VKSRLPDLPPWLSGVLERLFEKSKSLVIRIIKNDLGMACRLDSHPHGPSSRTGCA
jgi:hypothetical protein